MTSVRVTNFSISLDGYGAGPDQTLDDPLGVGGERVHDWFVATKTFRTMYGDGNGDEGLNDEFAARGTNVVIHDLLNILLGVGSSSAVFALIVRTRLSRPNYPLSVLLILAIAAILVWAVTSGQFDRLDDVGARVLREDPDADADADHPSAPHT